MYFFCFSHNDLPIQFRGRVKNRMDAVDLSQDVNGQWGPSQTDIPRLRQGQLGAQVNVIVYFGVNDLEEDVIYNIVIHNQPPVIKVLSRSRNIFPIFKHPPSHWCCHNVVGCQRHLTRSVALFFFICDCVISSQFLDFTKITAYYTLIA